MTDPLISIRDLHSEYLTSTRGKDLAVSALRGVSLDIYPGQTVSLVGESGSGKSTLSHALIGLLPDNARITSGTIHFRNTTEITTASETTLRALRGGSIGLIPQDPTVSLNPVYTIGHQLVEAVRAHQKIPTQSAAARARELLEDAGIDRPELRFHQYPHQISGGMRQRVLIAIALAGEPDLLIADEPTSALDASVQKKILDHLETLIAERGIALLLVTHDLAVAAERTEHMVVMNQGVIVESGPIDSILHNPENAYTQRLLHAAPVFAQVQHRPAPPRTSDDAPLLQVTDLRKQFALPAASIRRGSDNQSRHVTAVDGVSFQVHRGETLALVGESGSGKSTTARLVLGLETPDAGTITFEGNDITRLTRARWRQLRRRAQLIYQNPYASLDPRFTIQQIVTEPLDAFRLGTRADRARRAAELLDNVALPATFLERKPVELSGGQRQRVAIARALALTPDLVVCDEPVSALDVSIQAQVLDLLAELQESHGLTYLFITHDLAVVRQLAHRVIVMKHGSIVEAGETEQIFSTPQHPYTQQLLAAISGAHLLTGTTAGGTHS